MDDELFAALYQIAHQLWPKREKRVQHSGRLIVLLYLWSVIRNKPRSWVCEPRNLPPLLAGRPIPSRSQFGRRLNHPTIRSMLDQLEAHARDTIEPRLLGCWLIDAKPLTVSPYSKDKAAKWGWAYNGKARGYKLFAITDLQGNIAAWQIDAMNRSEPDAAMSLIDHLDRPGYLLGDSIYDSNPLHTYTASIDIQLIAPRKQPDKGLGNRSHHPNRLHAIAMLETFANRFGRSLYRLRTGIERSFARLAASTIGLDRLPPFVRTPARVRLWVQAKITLYAIVKTKT